MRKLLFALAASSMLSVLVFAADTFTCRAAGEGKCVAILTTQDGVDVLIELSRGQKLNRGNGQEFIQITSNWSKSTN